jgi:hypothetical protein
MRTVVVLCCLSMLAGCAYPVSVIEQGSASASLFFPGFPADASVTIDGAEAGQAAAFDGKKASLPVSTGKHHVVIRGAGRTLYDQSIYVGSGSHVAVDVH